MGGGDADRSAARARQGDPGVDRLPRPPPVRGPPQPARRGTPRRHGAHRQRHEGVGGPPGPPGWGANNEVHASWSIHHAVFRAIQDGAGLLLEVAAPSATSQALFERILISVRPGQQAGAPGSKRIAYGGVAFGVPRAWRVVREHDDPCASGTEAVFLGVDLDKARCTLPRSYLDVTRSKAPTGRLVKLNGFGLQYGLSGQAIGTGRWREEDTADLAVPALHFRMVTVRGQGEPSGAHLARRRAGHPRPRLTTGSIRRTPSPRSRVRGPRSRPGRRRRRPAPRLRRSGGGAASPGRGWRARPRRPRRWRS
jgi:hypothetical protein